MKILIVSEFQHGNGAAIAAYRLAEALGLRGGKRHDDGQFEVDYAFHVPVSPALPRAHSAQHHITGTGNRTDSKASPFPLAVHRFFSYNETVAEGFAKHLWAPIATLSARTCLRTHYAKFENDLRDLIRVENYDVVNFHNISTMLDHAFVSEQSRQRAVVWTLHDCHAVALRAYEFEGYDGGRRVTPGTLLSVHRDALQRLLHEGKNLTFVAPSRWLEGLAREAYGTKFPVHHVPYGMGDGFHPIARAEANRQLGLADSGDFTILFVASSLSNERKNLRVLLDALARLPQLPVRLLCLGAASKEIGDSRVTFLGTKTAPSDLRAAYNAADTTVMTSLIDNLPNTVLESLFCGTPVLGARCGGVTDMVREGESGWLFNPRSATELSEKLMMLCANRAEVSRIAATSRSFAMQNFPPEAEALRYEKLFRAAIES